MQKKCFKLTMLSVLCLSHAMAFASDANQDLIQRVGNIKVYEANFSQQIKDANGEQVSASKGTMTISRPNRFRWESKQPDPILVIGDGQTLWSYDKELDQATKQPLEKALTASPARLLAGSLSNIDKDFKVKDVETKQCGQESDKCFMLEPLQKDSPFQQAYLGFAKDKMITVRMNDALGQKIRTDFTNIKVNHSVNKQLFVFVPPKGVDVIEAGT